MNYRSSLSVTALVLAAALAGCGGGGAGGATPTGPGGGGGGVVSDQAQSETAISATSAFGSPLKSFTDYNNTISPQSEGTRPETASGTCNNYSEFFAPDKNGDPNSTEAQYFYDAGCTQIARDVVRIYTSTGAKSETVNTTAKLYAINNTTPSATRNDAVVITNASFDSHGYPIAAQGFDRSSTGSLDLAGSRTINSDAELVMLPASAGVNSFCSDSAGFNATGIPRLNETFGWNGGVLSGGTRTANGDSTVTWNATHAGSTFKGAIGSLSIATGTQNTACPISTPMFTLSGGTSIGTYSIPVVATFKAGLLVNLSITNAQLANGNALNVTTNTSVPPTSNLFITGIVSNGSTQIATFNVNAFGDGTLTITSSGTQYVINDWHVVK
jgi:hypothetical protein